MVQLFIGIDLAWSTRARTGVAAVSSSGALIDSTTVVTDEEIVRWIGGLDGVPITYAVDAPLVVTTRPASASASG